MKLKKVTALLLATSMVLSSVSVASFADDEIIFEPEVILKQVVKYAVGFLGVWMIFILSKALQNNRVGAVLKTVGDYSYDIYLMHNPYVVAVVAIACSRFLKLPGVCSLIIATAMGVIIPVLISKWIIRKNKVLSAVMIGQWG